MVPCIFCEETNNGAKILRFALEIEFDEYRYTAWRKFLGQTYNAHIVVYLINKKRLQLYDLNGDEINFSQLKRSDIYIDAKYLARFGYQDSKQS